jgi:integrase
VIRDADKKTENYLDKNKMVFNSYKTAKFYGTQELLIPKPLLSILKKWIGVNPTRYLLFDTNMNKLTNVKLNQRFNKIFGDKKISTNQMRHTYLTNKFGDTINKNKEIAKTMSDMGSSMGMATTYIKNDD